jgi:glycerate 2-kinase
MSARDARLIFLSAVEAVQPKQFMPQYMKVESGRLTLGDCSFKLADTKNIYIVAMGKAAAAMSHEAEMILGELISDGITITKYGHALPLKYGRCLQAGHPLPDANSLVAAGALLEFLEGKDPNDIIIVLISGGASALIADGPPGSSLGDLQALNQILLNIGVNIQEINTIRKHLSFIKGGQLVRQASPARVVSLILSDVPGDDPAIIASGPTSPDPSTFSDAWNILEKYRMKDRLAPSLIDWLQRGLAGEIPETLKPGDHLFRNTRNYIVGSNRQALEVAALEAEKLGYQVELSTVIMQGEASVLARELVEGSGKYEHEGPTCILFGGETTVTIRGNGRGGRNQEFALAAFCALQEKNISKERFPVILAAGTDGTDGNTDATGAIIDYQTVENALRLKLNPSSYLQNNDSYTFFKKVGGLLVTGPTQTNVMDLVLMLLPGWNSI